MEKIRSTSTLDASETPLLHGSEGNERTSSPTCPPSSTPSTSVRAMHARKLPRISEPSFDKGYYDHHSGKSYKTSKVSKSYSNRDGGSYRDSRRSLSPDGRSPRDHRERKYSRIRDRDRERDRDRDRDRDYYVSSSTSSKYRSSKLEDHHHCSSRDRSPLLKDHGHRSKWDHHSSRGELSGSKQRDKDSGGLIANSSATHANSNNPLSNSSVTESKIKSVGDWSEHTSSSGKKYYYNCITEVSQWEKPREWLEYERSRNNPNSSSSILPSFSQATSSSSKHCDSRNSTSNNKHLGSSSSSYSRSRDSYHRDGDGRYLMDGDSADPRNDHREHHQALYTSKKNRDQHQQDMDISSSRDATPTSENEDSSTDHRRNNTGNGLSGSSNHSNPLSAALPPMASQPLSYSSHLQHNSVNNSSTSRTLTAVSTQDAIKTIQTALLLTSGTVTTSSSSSSTINSHHHLLHSVSQNSNTSPNNHDSPYSIGGNATPTHSELDSGGLSNSSSVNSHHLQQQQQVQQQHQQSISNLVSSSPLTALKTQIPQLTPSLTRLYKESLISHVVGWPAESVERAAQRVNDDHNNISNLGITKVSAELKMARSLVRLAEIQATLQEQRILFLRQQSLDLESLKTKPPMMLSTQGPPNTTGAGNNSNH